MESAATHAARRRGPPLSPGAILSAAGLSATNPAACSGRGRWHPGAGVFPSFDPATGEAIAGAGSAEAGDYEQVLGDAVQAFEAWRLVPAPKRAELVRRVADGLRRNKLALAHLIALESGKIRQEAEGEVQEMIDIADLAVGQSRMLYGLTMPSERPRHRLYEQWHPLGVVGVITAFNFPVAVWAWNAFLAAVAGNSVVWKPSPKAPLSALAVQRLCNEAMAELDCPGVFSLLVSEGSEMGARLAADSRVALLSFTGSSAAGRQVAQAVAARMGRSLLECSGNNAVIVDESANLDLAVRAILFGAVGTAGQRCTSTRRLIVHEACLDPLVSRLRAAYASVRIGNPLDPATHMGPLIDAAAVEGFRRAIAEASAEGGELVYGGEALEGPGWFVEPTILRACNHWPVVQRETFAPLLYLLPCRDLEEAIALNNAAPQGLSSSLFTESLASAELFLSAVGSDCGIANVNAGTSGAEIGGAFGGEKETGGGREAGSDAWKAYMRRQTVTVNWGRDLPLSQGIRFDVT
jgi:aldehyde dehydrogenase (NAD+)